MISLLALVLSAAPAGPTVTGSLDKEVIRKVIHTHLADVRVCYARALERHPEFAGKVPVKFTISPEGTVSAAEVTEGADGDQEMKDCVVKAAKLFVFPKPVGGGTVIVTYPFMFNTKG